MRKITHFNKRFKEGHTGLTGLPLRIFIMVVIAGVCLVVILGYVVVSNPDLDSITIAKIEIDGVYFDRTIYCENTTYKDGDHWYQGAKRGSDNPVDYYSTHLIIICKNDDNKEMTDVLVTITGAGVNHAATTDINGEAKLSLANCHLGPNEWNGEIKITAKYDSTFGEQKKTTSVAVLAGSPP